MKPRALAERFPLAVGCTAAAMCRYVSSIVYNVITQTIGNVGFHKLFCLVFPSCAFVEACAQLAAGFDSPSSDYNHTGFNFSSVLVVQVHSGYLRCTAVLGLVATRFSLLDRCFPRRRTYTRG